MAAVTAFSMAASHGGGIAPGGDVPQAFAEDGPGQNGGRGRAVAGDIRRLRSHFVNELGAHVLEAVFKFDFLAYRNAVLGDFWPAERLVQHHIAAGGTHGHRDRIGQLFHALEHLGSGVILEH